MQDPKQKIIRSFSINAGRYDQHARVQKYAADRLCENIASLHIKPGSKILEIGCGTGFVSEKLIHMFPGCPLIVTDISPAMLEKCRDNLLARELDLESVYFQVLDGESIDTLAPYDLIISGLTVQWFEDFPEWLERGISTMRNDSAFVFSYLSDKSFPEWKDSCEQSGIPFSGNQLPDHALIRKLSKNKSIRCQWEYEFKTEHYNSLLHFFRELKHIGASERLSRNDRSTSPADLRKLNAFHSHGKSCEVSFHLVYGMIQCI